MLGETLEISKCEVCGSTELDAVLDLGLHPMCDDLVEVGDARQCAEYPIDILYCKNCRTAHQRYQVPKHDLFPISYHYRSRFTSDVLDGMRQLAADCATKFGDLANATVVDIGCNDGSLLDAFARHGAQGIGIEPTSAATDAEGRGHQIYQDYLSEEVAARIVESHGQPDFITFTNVFAHIEDLSGVLRAMKVLMSDRTVLVVENHYLGAVLDLNQFDTFYHEHPRTYSFASFQHIAQNLGVSIADVNFPSRYGGNIRVFMTNRPTDGTILLDEIDAREAQFAARFSTLNRNVEQWKACKRAQLAALAADHGPLPAKAFPGRAAILVKLLELDTDLIECCYEKPGSMKIGHYVPGTRIPIRSDDAFEQLVQKPPVLVNFAWHISSEIQAYLRGRGYEGQIVDLIESSDFN
ncbi:hypothetical protein POI8812_00453 [Pontivivens insulae]|uniref:Ubiquinone biosynthesis O-methyltransferase n=2 Tax=Pontivivens insulae TaxID=1639689 RepID=A0A2R8A7J3_9RHOB|nr:putative zinc binding protein [Pontivivens insulae]SPF28155.1 hypothetical protein POI8812_00453 [Pontivivens insulae]